LYGTSGGWDEDTVTYTTRPRPLGEPLASAGAVTLAQAVDFDVRRVVRPAGTYDFLLRGTSPNRARFRSREAQQSPPTLLLALHASTPPDLAVTSPEDGARVAPGTPLTLTARATDAEDGDLTPAIRWRSDGDGALGTGGSLSISTLGHGRHSLEATVVDSAGLQATSVVHVLVDSAPVLVLDAPADGTSIRGGEAVLLSAQASDAEDGDLAAAVRWSSDRDGDLGAGGTLPVTLSEGTHHVRARVEDADGVATEDTRTLIVAPTAPAVTIVSPAPAAVGVTGEAVAFAGGALDFADGDLAPRLVWESDLQGRLGTGALLNVTGLVAGTHVITAHATDRDGLVGSATVTVRILPAALVLPAVADAYVRADLPTTNFGRAGTLQTRLDRETLLRFVVPDTAGARIARATLRLTVGTAVGSSSQSGGTVSVTDTSWDERVVTYETRPQAGAVIATAGAVGQGQAVEFDVTAAVQGDGPVAFVLGSASIDTVKYASREATNGRPALVLQIGSTLTTPDTLPTVTITAPADGDVVTLGAPVTLAATVTDADEPGLDAGLVWYSDVAGLLGIGTPLTIPDLPAGRHHLRAEVTDAHGSTGAGQATLLVNAPPRIAILSPSGETSVPAGTPVTLVAEAMDAEDGALNSVVWASDRDGVLGGGATLTVATLSIGPHRLTATVADTRGATASAAAALTVTAGTLLFAPAADATVKADAPDTRFGTNLTLQADADPVRRAYLRFVVGGVGHARVTAATLRLTVRPEAGSGSGDGGTLTRLTPTPWQEPALTFTTSPAIDGLPVAALGPVADGQVVTVDLTPVVTGDGVYELALTTASTDRVSYWSREVGADGPQLLVTVE